MSIGKQVTDAINKMQLSDYEGALFAICAAIEATAKKEFAQRGREAYKKFVHENFGLITEVGLGSTILNLYLSFDHPELKKNSAGSYKFEDILYHVVRCGLYHDASLPNDLRFTDEKKIRYDNGALILPAAIIYGLIMAVVVSPANQNESADKWCVLNFGDFPIPISRLWGRRHELVWLLDALKELRNLQCETQ